MERPSATRFEDLIAWQKARALTETLYLITSAGSFSVDFGLRDQVRRSAVSIMANIAEGFERGTPSEFHQLLAIARGSCAELRSHIYVAFDAKHIDTQTFSRLMHQSEEVASIVGALRLAVKKRRDNAKLAKKPLVTWHSLRDT